MAKNMPHFFNIKQNYYISTNYKVLYSLLYSQPSLQVAAKISMAIHTYLNRFTPFHLRCHFLLVRDPYKRLVSFYKDKFRQQPLHKWLTYDELQICQRLFCPYIQINPYSSPADIREKLLSVSFTQFINLLPQVYHLDDHLRPQTRLTMMFFHGIPIGSIKFERILKVESSDDMAYLQDELSIGLSKKYNNTDKILLPNPWSPALRAVVNNLYQADFEAFNYEMRTV
ncbi:hypothetical protein PN36_11450 [Candidatus Thiomargarita nelsonii]|uniref:Carbohydrate sulfotransferase n=1 Tax=Candidatus Thiomargarita nelsonii TaxID=1003181 RepID=A0A4E0QR43_9GAMM|nr:hypothetical protein PN36_11450 [Candidatus Thiomargarita nelsonii]